MMKEPMLYSAFGLTIASPFPIAQAMAVEQGLPVDVTIVQSDFSDLNFTPGEHIVVREHEVLLYVPEVGKFRMTGGNRIEVDPVEGHKPAMMDVYLMGSCMGVILQQRGMFLLHGSCVTDGKRAILIVGDSGAGKSTLAAEFVAQGWRLMTDDVSAVEGIGSKPTVRSSYPTQRLWADAVARYGERGGEIRSLYTEGDSEKFGLDASRYFWDTQCPICLILLLLPRALPRLIQPIEGMAKIDQLMRNTYRLYLMAPNARQEHFRRCFMLAEQVPMAFLLRDQRGQCASDSYALIMNYLGELEHD